MAGGVGAVLRAIGRPVRARLRIVFGTAGLAAWIATRAVRPGTWQRATVRAEFFRRLRQSLLGGLLATLVLGVVVGAGLVFQGIYWLGAAGQRQLLASILVTVLVRELVPVLVGLLLLGRAGTVTIAELGAMRSGGGTRAHAILGVDNGLLFALPATVAYALAAFTLGVACASLALVTGSLTAFLLGDRTVEVFGSLNDVLQAMRPVDAVLFPLKLLILGALVGVTASHTALSAEESVATADLLPTGFVRGVLAVVVTSALMSLAA
ncbi:MAG: ABC transporter permease [Acetobacteraceae bacterium]|nr:ABC transporter permease [Acetobacteraceae bacterium]